MSDTDYINDHMGGFDSDGLPNFMNAPGFDDDGYGNVDYAFYHSNRKGFRSLLFAVEMTLEAVQLLPYYLDDNAPDGQSAYSPELVGIADGWREIHTVLRWVAHHHEDYFIFIHPEKEILQVFAVGNKQPDQQFQPQPFEVSNEKEWHYGIISALTNFNKIFKKNASSLWDLNRLTKNQFIDYQNHKILISAICLELENLNQLGDKGAIKNKLIGLVTEYSKWGVTEYSGYTEMEVSMEGVKTLVEISTKDNLMPTFKIEPSDCETYRLYEVSLKGDIISLHSITNEELKDKYQLVDGAYSVPLLDLVTSEKKSNFKYLYK